MSPAVGTLRLVVAYFLVKPNVKIQIIGVYFDPSPIAIWEHTIVFIYVCPTSRRNNVNQHYLPYSYICTCAGTKQLDIHKTCAVTLTGKCLPNRDSELQRTELVQDTKALMVQDTKI